MKNNKFFIIVIIVIFILSGCTTKIIKYKYIQNLRGYSITIRGKSGFKYNAIARNKNGVKIQTEEEIKEFIEKYKETFKIETADDWDLKEVDKFELSKLYYNGLRAYSEKDFNNAIKWFEKAMEFDSNIYKYSDIFYLLGKSYYYLGDNKIAKEFFKLFIKFSESISHPNLQYFVFDPDYRR